jgi:hypothetical protein
MNEKHMRAFPYLVDDGKTITGEKGMMLRDYFAGKALQGLLANPKLHNEILNQEASWIYDSAWAMASKMMETRKNESS